MSTYGSMGRAAIKPPPAGVREALPAPDEGVCLEHLGPELARRQLQASLGVLGLIAAVGVTIATMFGTGALRPADRSAGAAVSRATVQQPQFVRPVKADRVVSPTGG